MAKNTKRNDQSAKIREVRKQILANSKDVHFAEELLKQLHKLEKIANQEPMVLSIKESEVVQTLDFDSFTISRCANGYWYHIRGGYDIFISWRMRSIAEHLHLLFDYKSRMDELTEEEKERYDALFTATNTILQAPIIAPITGSAFFSIANTILSIWSEESERLLARELQDEDYIANAEFESAMQATDELKTIMQDVKRL